MRMRRQGRITWKGINRNHSGVISGDFTDKNGRFLGYAVRMDDGGYMIVHPKSIINEETAQ